VCNSRWSRVAGVLAELKEYAQEVDVDFVRKAVSCIGQVAIRLEAAAQKCVEALLELMKLKVSYVVQEAVVVIKEQSSLTPCASVHKMYTKCLSQRASACLVWRAFYCLHPALRFGALRVAQSTHDVHEPCCCPWACMQDPWACRALYTK
jgi:hypothetical protein